MELDSPQPGRTAEIESALANLRSSLREPPSRNVLVSRKFIATFFIAVLLLAIATAFITRPLTVSEVARNPLTLLADKPAVEAEHDPSLVADVAGAQSGGSAPGAGLASPIDSPVPTAFVPTPAATLEPEPTWTPVPTESPAPTETPRPTEYTVQSGDSLTAICTRLIPELASADCIEEMIALNGLSEQGEIAAGQLLLLITPR